MPELMRHMAHSHQNKSLQSHLLSWPEFQRRRGDNIDKIYVFEGGGLGAEREIVQKRLSWETHDNTLLKVQIYSREILL